MCTFATRQADDLLSGAPTEGIRKLMQAAATGPDGRSMGVNEDLILELDVRSCQVRVQLFLQCEIK